MSFIKVVDTKPSSKGVQWTHKFLLYIKKLYNTQISSQPSVCPGFQSYLRIPTLRGVDKRIWTYSNSSDNAPVNPRYIYILNYTQILTSPLHTIYYPTYVFPYHPICSTYGTLNIRKDYLSFTSTLDLFPFFLLHLQ